jgi:hypothetical protein
MQHLSENRARPRIGRALGRAAAAVLCVAVLSQPNFAYARGGGEATVVEDSTVVAGSTAAQFTRVGFTAAAFTTYRMVPSPTCTTVPSPTCTTVPSPTCTIVSVMRAATIGTTAGTTDATAGGCGDPGWHGPTIIANRTAPIRPAITPT